MLILSRTKEVVLALDHVRISDSVNEWSCIYQENEEDRHEEFGANSTGVEVCLFLFSFSFLRERGVCFREKKESH